MEYNSLDKINILKAGTQKEKIESFAILPPCLTKELFENINPEANHLLLKLLQKIRELREPEKKDETRPWRYIDNASYEEEESKEEHEKKEPNWEPDEKAFHKPLIFLWAIMSDSKSIPGTPLTIFNKTSTKKWEMQITKNISNIVLN